MSDSLTPTANEWAWPTPSARDFKGVDRTDIDRGNARPLNEVVAKWSTPRASDGEKGGPNQSFGAGGVPLPAQASHWETPTIGCVTGGQKARSGARSDELLINGQAAQVSSLIGDSMQTYLDTNTWPTAPSLSRPRTDETLAKSAAYRKAKAGQNTVPLYLEEVTLACSHLGQPTSTDGATSSPEPRSLNPLFVGWLMGWPPGWTNFGCSETALYRWKAHMRSALMRLGLPPAAPLAQHDLFN